MSNADLESLVFLKSNTDIWLFIDLTASRVNRHDRQLDIDIDSWQVYMDILLADSSYDRQKIDS